MTDSQNKSGYMPSLDGIRGFACLLVIATHIANIFHLNFMNQSTNLGASGVLIFFSLSGFLMSTLYSRKDFNLQSAGKYAIARAARIAPAYYVAIIVAWLLYMAIPGFEYQMTPLMMVRSLAFSGNQGVFWSIPPEVQFYGFFLLLWFAYDRFRNGNKLWLILCAVLCAVFMMTHKLWGGLMLPSKLHIFLFGFLAAFLLAKAPIKKLLGSIPFQASVTAATILYGIYCMEKGGMYNDFLFAGLVSLSIASLSHSTRLTAPLESATMRMLGAVSFSVYLFHDMILHVIKNLGLLSQTPTMMIIAVAVIVSLAIPVAFHFLAERHMNAAAKDRMMFYFNGYVVPFFERRKAAKV